MSCSTDAFSAGKLHPQFLFSLYVTIDKINILIDVLILKVTKLIPAPSFISIKQLSLFYLFSGYGKASVLVTRLARQNGVQSDM